MASVRVLYLPILQGQLAQRWPQLRQRQGRPEHFPEAVPILRRKADSDSVGAMPEIKVGDLVRYDGIRVREEFSPLPMGGWLEPLKHRRELANLRVRLERIHHISVGHV